MSDSEKINTILRHIKRVEDNCNALARKFQHHDLSFALNLIKAGRMHDVSKFDTLEFHHLHTGAEYFESALQIHHSKNPHHPECWNGGIKAMPDLYLAEMVCDCVARGQEFGTNPREWFYEKATLKYNFTMEDECGQKIEKYLNLLLTEPF